FTPYYFHDDILRDAKRAGISGDNLKQVLTAHGPPPQMRLEKHRSEARPQMEIALGLELNDNDLQNIEFIYSNRNRVNELVTTYSNVNQQITANIDPEALAKHRSVTITLRSERAGVPFATYFPQHSPELMFITEYLQRFDLYKAVIQLHNALDGGQKPWP